MLKSITQVFANYRASYISLATMDLKGIFASSAAEGDSLNSSSPSLRSAACPRPRRRTMLSDFWTI